MALQLNEVLNSEQTEAAGTIEGPVLIIAGAGSGKTRMITYRIAYMLEQGIAQKHILALTFTNKAAHEMTDRITSVTGKPQKQLTASTFHAFGLRILRKEAHLLGYPANFTIYDTQDKMSMLKAVIAELGMDPKSLDLYAISEAISSVKTERVSRNELSPVELKIAEEYRQHLHLYHAFDFDDLIMQPLELFEAHPEVLELYRDRYRYILVDEFQDTSMQQYKLVRLLSEKHRNLCVVGDDDQSIYSWRGADFRNIINFERDFPEGREIKLEQNYRSTGSILTLANTLIKNNTNRKSKNLWTGGGEAGIVGHVHPEDEQDEADFIADKIRETALRDAIRYNDFGILVRTNNLIPVIEHALMASSIPYKVSGSQSFFQRKEIKDITAYMRVMANPDDNLSLLRIINTPRRGIGKTTLVELRETAEKLKCSLFSAMNAVIHAADRSIREATRIKVRDFVETIELHREQLKGKKKIADTVSSLIGEVNYRSGLITEHPDNEQLTKWKMKNIDLFIQIIGEWEGNPDNFKSSLYDFLGSISLKGSSEPNQEQGKVNLMTIHASKGLEFHTVFLAGVEDHIIPHKRAIEENPENIEEERRLFYVAITRARQNLYMLTSSTRKVMREIIDTLPSRFLEELPKDSLIHVAGESNVEKSDAASYFTLMKEKFAKKN